MDRQAIRRFAQSSNREERRKAECILRTSQWLKPGTVFYTGNGKKNLILMRNKVLLYLKAEEGNKTVKVPLKSMKNLISYFLRIRIIERKEVEGFHAYNSALFGLLHSLFKNKVKLNKNGNLLRLVLIGIRMFLAGFERSPADLLLAVSNGARYVLASYYYARQSSKWRERIKQYGLRAIMDCGQYSTWSAILKGKEIKQGSIQNYCKFIADNLDVIDHYFAYDEIGDWKKTMNNLAFMEEQGLNPIPIFLMGTPFEVLVSLVEKGYPVIALGGTVNQRLSDVAAFLDKVFSRYPTQAFHGLGISRAAFLNKYPFYSCDSKSWILVRWKAKILRHDRQEDAPEVPVTERMKESLAYWLGLEEPKLAV